ncbi:VWA domain-containing protein [Thalassotalea piscium]|uniref:VWFA domain-containing protein n=1 Tax=Thalassotalea piscium TaxID=1230533 RepID=A0A7X0TTC8_9GAMM|nr:VWA domain-containing protein [Thalassotalea piscium]MBB6543122.1 hypothetical protein [Thalassotalea piscium]
MQTQTQLKSMQIGRMKNSLLKKFRSKSRVMSPKTDIKIVLKGQLCCADYNENTIYLPAGDFNDENYLQMLEGAVDHEIGHMKHSTKEAVIKAKSINEFVNNLRNLVEDIRMERLVVREFPGARRTLSGLVDQAIKLGWFSQTKPEETPIRLLHGFLLYYCRYHFMHQVQLQQHQQLAKGHLEGELGNVFVDELINIVSKIPELKCADDSVTMAITIYDLLKQELPENQEQEKQEQESSDDSEDSDENSSGADQSSDENSIDDSSSNANENTADQSQGTDEEGEGSNEQSTDSESPSNAIGGQSPDAQRTNQPLSSSEMNEQVSSEQSKQAQAFIKSCLSAGISDFPEDLHEMINKELEAMVDDALKAGSMSDVELNPFSPAKHQVFGEIDFNVANKASSRVKNPLQRALYDMNRQFVSHTKRGVNLDGNRLAGVSSRNFHVFKDEIQTKAPNTAISIVIDRSGSMIMDGRTQGGVYYPRGFKMKVANEAAFALAKGIDSLPGAECEVMYYPFEENTVHIAKSFKEKTTAAKNHFKVDPHGGTPTGRAMQLALQRLAQRPEPRKMMFVLTDGDPNYDEYDLINQTLTEASVLGIDIAAFGVCTDSVVGFEGSGFVHVDDVKDLHTAVKDAIKQRLFG